MPSRDRHFQRPLFVLAALITPLALFAMADQSIGAMLTARWIGTADGKWSIPSNWDIGQVPNNANGDVFDVVWDTHPVSITLDRNIVIRNFTFAQPGELTGVATLTIEGNLDWRAGSMAGNGPAISVIGNAALHSGVALAGGRILNLGGKSELSGDLVLRDSSSLTIAVTGELDLLDGANLRSALAGFKLIENLGTVRIFPNLLAVTIEPLVRNKGLLSIYAREVVFKSAFFQNAGRTELFGTTIPAIINIDGGELAGQGHVANAFVSGRISGQFTFDFLELDSSAKLSPLIRGRGDGMFDKISANTIILRPGAMLEASFAAGAEKTIQNCDTFGIVSSPFLLGTFTNVVFGGRLLSTDASGTFLVENQGPSINTGSIVLRDWISNVGNNSSCVHFSETAATYPLQGSLVLDPAATVAAPSSANWQGGSLLVRMSETFSPNVDSLDLLRATNAPGRISLQPINGRLSAVSLNGVEFAEADFQGATLTVSFTKSTSAQALEALLRSLVFRNAAFNLPAASAYDFPDREVEIRLTTPPQQTVVFSKRIQFPHFPGTISQAMLFSLRSLINQTPEGSALLGSILPHTAEIAGLVVADPGLAKEMEAVATSFQQVVSAVLSGHGSTTQITLSQIDQLEVAWAHLGDLASPALRLTLQTVRDGVGGFQQFVGHTVAQSAALLRIPVPQQPVFYTFKPQFRNGQFSLQANLVAGLQYFLRRAFEVTGAAWEPVTNANISVDGSTVTLTDTNFPGPHLFYQVGAKDSAGPLSPDSAKTEDFER